MTTNTEKAIEAITERLRRAVEKQMRETGNPYLFEEQLREIYDGKKRNE